MRKAISTIVAIVFISSMLVNTAFADHGHIDVFNPLWLPVEILSTVAATVSTIVLAPFAYEHRGYPETRHTVIYEEPRNYRQDRYYERAPSHYYYDERGRAYEAPRYREYR